MQVDYVLQPLAHRLHRHAVAPVWSHEISGHFAALQLVMRQASFNNLSSLVLNTLRQREAMSDYLLAKTAADVAAWVAVANHLDSFRT